MNPKVYLTVAGNVEKFVTITPQKVSLVGVEGQKLKTEVKIVPEKKYPFKILDVITNEKSNISYRLKEIKTSDKLEYIIEIQNLKKDKGAYFEAIELKTDSDIRPKIKIHVNGSIREKPENG